ncbi:glutathione synthase [Candidatus Mycalebacterium sp.]
MAFIMDPIESLNPARDTTLVLMLEAQARGHEVFYVKPETLSARGGEAMCKMAEIRLTEPRENARDMEGIYETGKTKTAPLAGMDVVWMRKDPPFNMDYIYLTHILSLAESAGTTVINRPEAIRKSNEKLSALGFSKFMADTLVSKNAEEITDFLSKKTKIVVKPLDGFGGEGIVMLEKGSENVAREIDRLTSGEQVFVMAQEFISGVLNGDKRIIMLGGEPVGAVLRMPPEGGFICNFHSGGTPEKTELNDRDREICSALKNYLIETGIYFAGIDIVGGMLTEINCTSPTCVREINRFEGVKLERKIVDFAEALAEKTGNGK